MTLCFTSFSKCAARALGGSGSFIAATSVVLLWIAGGFIIGFTDSWQIVINTITSIVTFLMVFLIQNTQNRDTEAMQIKLDELIRAVDGARNNLMNLEDLGDEELDVIRARYLRMADRARKAQAENDDVSAPAPG